MTRNLRLALVVAVLPGVLLLGACGGGDDGSDSAESAAPQSPETTTTDPFIERVRSDIPAAAEKDDTDLKALGQTICKGLGEGKNIDGQLLFARIFFEPSLSDADAQYVVTTAQKTYCPEASLTTTGSFPEAVRANFLGRLANTSDDLLMEMGEGICRGVRRTGNNEGVAKVTEEQLDLSSEEASKLVDLSLEKLCPELTTP